MGTVEELGGLLIRWAHVVAAITCIGTSFDFRALGASLKRRANGPEGVRGESWSVHGGGFYHIQKDTVAPSRCPKRRLGTRGRATRRAAQGSPAAHPIPVEAASRGDRRPRRSPPMRCRSAT
ncbi:urate hydroxylase PuuD [Acuticoccus sp.]|uniref:urate hydroxylase PuuD n=1 Tax=Acuticoccus sp. TaxID=1904378 RepID=UPI003B529B62